MIIKLIAVVVVAPALPVPGFLVFVIGRWFGNMYATAQLFVKREMPARALGFSSMILWWARIYHDFEVKGNSLERLEGYVVIEQEPKPVQEKKPAAAWPTSGDLRVEGLSACYSPDGAKVQ
ncbi:unnamed protein product [Peniophora sp. CBMAI 1063]|nr:unnamed protein product [Peniophora sp. CBMAI 1063]